MFSGFLSYWTSPDRSDKDSLVPEGILPEHASSVNNHGADHTSLEISGQKFSIVRPRSRNETAVRILQTCLDSIRVMNFASQYGTSVRQSFWIMHVYLSSQSDQCPSQI